MSQLNSRVDDTSRLINLSDLVLDIIPLSIIPASTQEEARPSASKDVRGSCKSSISNTDKYMIDDDIENKYEKKNLIGPVTVDENLSEDESGNIDVRRRKFVTRVLKEAGIYVESDSITFK